MRLGGRWALAAAVTTALSGAGGFAAAPGAAPVPSGGGCRLRDDPLGHAEAAAATARASEIQMMTLPPGQFVITDSSVATPVTTGQVKAVTPGHYVLSEGQPELEEKQASALSAGVQVQPATHGDLDPQTTSQQQPTQYIITATTNGNGSSEVHITKP